MEFNILICFSGEENERQKRRNWKRAAPTQTRAARPRKNSPASNQGGNQDANQDGRPSRRGPRVRGARWRGPRRQHPGLRPVRTGVRPGPRVKLPWWRRDEAVNPRRCSNRRYVSILLNKKVFQYDAYRSLVTVWGGLCQGDPGQMEHGTRDRDSLRRNMGPVSQTGSDIIQRPPPPCEQTPVN